MTLDSRATGISGTNASGKTSFLEAIFFLAHGRSFRSPLRSELIRKNSDRFRIVGTLVEETGRSLSIGTEYDGSIGKFRISGEPASTSAVAAALPVQVIDPSIHRIVEEGSLRRRRLMDWGVFHVKPPFLTVWRRYQRILAQRNAALHAGATGSALNTWSEALVEAASPIQMYRTEYVALLVPVFAAVGAELLGEKVDLTYRPGWAMEKQFGDALLASRARELKQRTTVVGPHRADLEIQMEGGLARKRVSRGQQKLLAAALILAQIELRARTQPSSVCLLLDDPAAELDAENLDKLLTVVGRLSAQLIVTSLEPRHFDGISIGSLFHVEQGRFRQVI